MSCNVGVLKTAQCFVAEWLGHSVTVRVRARVRARECTTTIFFSGLRKCDEHPCLSSLL